MSRWIILCVTYQNEAVSFGGKYPNVIKKYKRERNDSRGQGLLLHIFDEYDSWLVGKESFV